MLRAAYRLRSGCPRRARRQLSSFVAHGFSLAFLSTGTSYLIFFKAFIVPIAMVVRTCKARASRPVTASAAVPE